MRTLAHGVRWMLQGRTGFAATIQTFLVRLLILSINLATGIITARLLEPVGRGEQAAMILWPQFLAYAMTLGLPAALAYNLKRYPEKKSHLFAAALILGTLLGLLATVTGIIFIPQWLNHYSPEVIYFAQWFMLTAPLSLLSVIFMNALEVLNDFTTANHMRYLLPLTTLGMLLLFVLTGTLTPFTSGLAYIVPTVPIFLWMLVYTWRLLPPLWNNLVASSKQLLSYGVRAYGIDLLSRLSLQIDQALVIGLLEPASLGLYVVALSLSRMLSIMQASLVTVLFPKAAARPVAEVVALIGRAARISAAFSLLAAIALMILGPVLLRLLYGVEFVAAVPVFRILIIEVVIGDATWVLAQAFMALGRPGTVTILQGIGLGLSVPMMLVLIPRYELQGAAIALFLSTIVRLIFVLISYQLVLKVRPPSLLITLEDLAFIRAKVKFVLKK